MNQMENHQNTGSTERAPRRGRGRWSAVDTVILLLVLVAVGGIVGRVIYAARQSAAEQTAMYAVYFEVAETHEDVIAEVQGFDAVYLYDSDVRLGYIGVYEDTVTGEYRVALTVTPIESIDGRRMATATGCLICTDGTLSEGSLLVEGSEQYLTPGSEVNVRTDRACLTVRITSIRPHS